jgi:hypothetical protein
LRTFRHNNTFKLLHELLQIHNEGRWPILSVDLGEKTGERLQNTNAIRNINYTRRRHTRINTSNARWTPKRQNTHKTPYHHTQHYPPKTQKTKTPQTGHHKSHRIHHKRQGCPSGRPHMQKPQMPSNNIM